MNGSTVHQIFYLKKAQGKETTKSIVFLRITIDGQRLEISMHRQMETSEWNSITHRLEGRSMEVKSFNAYLDAVQLKISNIHRDLVFLGKEVSCEAIKAKYYGIDKGPKRMLIDIYTTHNKEFAALVEKKFFSTGTLKRFKVCKKSLEEFLKWKFKVDDIDITKLNYEFLTDYEFYLKTEQNCRHNTAMGYIKKLRKIVNQCVAKDWLVKDPFMTFQFSLEETHRTILNYSEILRVQEKVFTTTRMDQIRDIFLFSCYTGLAYCDVEKLTAQDLTRGILGLWWVTTLRIKTKNSCRIPLLPQALEILKKYKDHPMTSITGKLLPVISNQKMNTFLKELTVAFGIDKELSFHCARHTFATTICLCNGVPIETVSKLLAHKSIRTTQIYAKVIDLKVSDDMKELRRRLDSRQLETTEQVFQAMKEVGLDPTQSSLLQRAS